MREKGQILKFSKKYPKCLLRVPGTQIGKTAAEKPTVTMAKGPKYAKKQNNQPKRTQMAKITF